MRVDVTRDVVLDLLPVYLADDVRADTRALVEAYLEQCPEVAEVARRSLEELGQDAPNPLTKENGMKTYEQAKR